MATTQVDRPASDDAVRDPSVLVVLVASDAVGWLRECLQGLAAQTHPRLGVVAVDNGSTDGTSELLAQALGEQRVLRLDEDHGFAGAVRAAVELPAAQAADYLLVMHDDTALEPDAVDRMVAAAEGIRGVERVGIVGPKVVDWADPRMLREVGRSTDRFGHPYSPLQDGELDQGQYDRVLEVLFVSSCAMLISRDAWQRTGAFDERFAGHHDDLDFCWRARLAGFRVLMTPLAVARHRGVTASGERPAEHRRRSARYYGERAALAAMLKDYGVPTLLWLLPVYLASGLVRLVALAITRRFDDAFDLLAAWGWNVVHLPGTVRRRVRAQSVRSVRDRSIRRFMSSSLRLPRWFERAEEFLDEGFDEIDLDHEPVARPLRARAAALALGHPVLLATAVGVALGALAVRHFVGPEPVSGGVLPAFPGHAGDFFRELVSGVRTTALGGTQPASPALAVFGATMWAAFGNAALAQKVLLALMPALAAVLAYRAFARQTHRPSVAVLAAGAYVLSATTLWAFSEGRIGLSVCLAALPVIWDRLDGAFARTPPARPLRFGVGLGVAAAVALAFDQGFLLPIGLVAAVHVIAARRRDRGLGLATVGVLAAALLAFPVLIEIASDPSASLASYVGTEDPWRLLRLSPGPAPGGWVAAAFLPVAAVLCFAAVSREHRGRAWRAVATAVSGIGLAWASANGYLPTWATNAPGYLSAATFGCAAAIAYGGPSLLTGLGRRAFGMRQIGAAALTVVLGVGFLGQTLQVALAQWSVRPNGLPPAWPIVDGSAPGEFRILWLGGPRGDRFPAPGGDPVGLLPAGDASVRYALTDRHGASALDVGRADWGDGYVYLRRALDALLAGGSGHGGALLAPLGVRFVVAAPSDLPAVAMTRLDAQVDLDRVPAGGLTIFRNAAALPTAFLQREDAPSVPVEGDLAAIAERPRTAVQRVPPPEAGRAVRVDAPGTVVIADQFDGSWRVRTAEGERVPQRAFGWAMAAPAVPGDLGFSYADQWIRTLEMGVLAVLWLAALWITRRPGSA
jgi:GT2 family glycosyltransferase